MTPINSRQASLTVTDKCPSLCSWQPSFERIAAFAPLLDAARRAARGKRLRSQTLRFLLDVETEVWRLVRELNDGTYRPQPFTTFEITQPKPRTISAAAFRDRVVHHALCAEIEPALERNAVDESFACRCGKGMKRALCHLKQLVRQHHYALNLDIRHFFETLSHTVLKCLLRRIVRDERVRRLAELFVDVGVPGSQPGFGVPIGNLTSQHFANFYLGPLDRHIKRGLRVPGYCRYMDDMVLVGDDKKALWAWHDSVRRFAAERLQIDLKAEVTRLVPVTEGVHFLGFVVFPSLVRFDPVRLRRFRKKCRQLAKRVDRLECSEEDAQRSACSLIGWSGHGDTLRMRQSLFARLG